MGYDRSWPVAPVDRRRLDDRYRGAADCRLRRAYDREGSRLCEIATLFPFPGSSHPSAPENNRVQPFLRGRNFVGSLPTSFHTASVELGPSFIPNADVDRNVRYPRTHQSQFGHEETVSNAAETSGERPFAPPPVAAVAVAARRRHQSGEAVEQLERGEEQRTTAAGSGLGVVVDEALGVELA